MAEPTPHAESVAAIDLWTYPFRRLWWVIVDPSSACIVLSCARPRVGYSQYCRRHTDAIMQKHTDES